MDDQIATTSAAIEKAGEHLKQIRPMYDQIINYYQLIFIEQESAKNAIECEPIRIPQNHLEAKLKENLPLIDISQFVVDKPTAGYLLSRICTITEEAGLKASTSARKLKSATNSNHFDLEGLIATFLSRIKNSFEELAAQFGIDHDFLWLVTYHSVKPSIEKCSTHLIKSLHPDHSHPKGYCPICGSKPVLSVLGKDAERYLCCGFCWHKWQVKRIFCPSCGNNDNNSLQYFYSEDEKGYRVELCEQCKGYLKCIDLRDAQRTIFLPLELVSTIHWDLKAQEAGYRPFFDEPT